MTAQTLTLADFLLARIAEDEAPAYELVPYDCPPDCCAPAGWVGHRCLICGDPPSYGGTVKAIEEIAREHDEQVHRRSRVLAECEAKKDIVKWHQNWPVLVEKRPALEQTDPPGDPSSMVMRMTQEIAWLTEREYRSRFGSEPPTGPVLRYLAGAYADHPDYRSEWRP